MKIAFNPSTVAALITPPNNKDITFDLRGRNIFARGVKFCGTDTNTWRDIKINNVSIGSNILDLRNGSNTTLTNINGVVTINSTWRPVVDNLTSDSTTSSLSAKQGKVLKSLIDGKSNSGHTHDDRYLKLTGGTMASNALITFADSGSWGTDKGPQGARGGLYWTGQSDYAKLYAEETVGDNLDLVIQFGDDNSNGLSIRNKANAQTSYISAGGVITTGTFKGNLDWSYITNKPSSYTPSAHTHAWNSLTHSSTTENQAILTNGKANGWKLYTLNISRWDNAANNAHSHANKSVLDGITSALVNNWNVAYTFVNTITGTDTDKVINKWDEIVNFLAGITEDNKLNTLLNSKLSIYELANNTNVGAIKNNGIYYSTTDASSGTLTNSPFNTGFALINMTSYDGGDDLRRSRLAFNAYGEIKVSNDRGQSNTTETWYQVLTSHNTYISNGSGIINGTTITQVSNADTTDGVHLEWSGQLTYDQYSWLAGWTNDGKKIKAVNKSQFATSGHTHDDRYLRLTGGWMSGDINFGGDNKIHWGRNTDSASISFKNDGDGDADSYMSFVTSDNGNEYFRWSHSSGSTNIEWMALRSDGLRVGGTKVSLEGHSHNDLYYTKTEVNNKLNGKSDTSHTHDDRYLKLTGGTMSGTIYRNSGGTTISGRDHAIIRQTHAPGGSSWNPIACVDTETGTWTLGHLSSGSNNTDFNFCFSTNADYNAGNNNGNYVTLRNKVGTIALLSDIPSSLKNPYALTISLNGTSQGPYDGSAAKNINITPGSIGAAVSNHSHDYLVVNAADNKSFNSAYHNFQVLYAGGGNGITGKPTNVDAFGLFKFRVASGWSGQMLLANGGSLYIRSSEDAKITNTLAWKTILDSSNYSGILDSRYYTESEVNSLLDAKLNRQNLSYGTWNPRGYHLAADYYYNGGDLSISESGGKIHISVDGYFWQNEGQYRVLDTSDISSIRGGLTLYQHLSATDTTRYPLVWGGSDHKNTNNSTGSLYKSYDKLSWQTSSQTLYATNIQTENIKHLSIEGGIYWNPYVESTTDGTDAASITVVKSGVAGGTTLVLSQMNDSNDTIQFKTNGSARLYHNSYPILTTQNTYVSNNKGYINGTEITQVNNANLLDGLDWNNFFSRRFYTFDLGSYSLSNFYPLFFVDTDIELDCEIHSNGGGWQDPYNQNRLHFQITSRGWTDTNLSFHLLSQDIYDINEITIGSIGIGTRQGGICIWVRGGRTYRVYSNREPLFKSSNYTYGDEIYSVGTNIWGGTNTNVNLVWKNDSTRKNALIATLTDNVASATKLQTSRTIWGQSFDGTGNVDGELVVNGQIRSSFASNNGNPCIMVNPTNDTDWCYGIEVLATKLTAGHRTGAYWAGKTNSTNNAICMSYYHAGDGSEDNRLIWHTWGSGDKMMLTANGRVGIGATPSYKLHVDGDIYTTTGFKKNGSSDSYVLLGGGGHKLESSLSVASASVASKVYGQVGDTGSHELVRCDMNNDQFRIIAGSSGNNNGWAEIATADDGNEPIYVRQYTGVFSSVVRTLTLLDANGYTHFPSYINIGGNENNNSSPDRVWGSNGSDSYLRSYRTSALRVSYANSADTATTSSMLKTADWNGPRYVSSDTHYMCLGYMNCTGSYDSLTLLVTSAFWGNQHGSQDIITIQQSTNTNDTARIQTTVGRLRLGGSYERSFYYYKDNSNFRLYLYVYVTGGNSYGRWNISYLGGNVTWVTAHQENVTKSSSWISIKYSAQVNYANSADSATKLQTPRTIWGQSFDGTANVDNTLRIRQTIGNYCEGIRIQTADGAWSTIILGATGDSGTNANAWSIHRKSDNNFAISRNSSDGTNGLVMTSTGMGLGTTAPTQRLDVHGNIRATGNSYATHFYESSDKTLKKNIKSILSSANIPKIREFDWKDTGEHSYGFIAQELEEQGYGCLVSEANGKKTVNYTATLALTVAKLQNLINIQNKKISNLTKELKALKYGRKKNS